MKTYKGFDCSFALKMERLDTLALIDYLQQEQPEPFSCGHENDSEPKPEGDLITEYDERFDSDPVYRKLVNRSAGIAIARHLLEQRV